MRDESATEHITAAHLNLCCQRGDEALRQGPDALLSAESQADGAL